MSDSWSTHEPPYGDVGSKGTAADCAAQDRSGDMGSRYRRLGALDSATVAMMLSLGAMTTVDSPGLVLQPQWQMMGVLEVANGALLFGIGAACILWWCRFTGRCSILAWYVSFRLR